MALCQIKKFILQKRFSTDATTYHFLSAYGMQLDRNN